MTTKTPTISPPLAYTVSGLRIESDLPLGCVFPAGDEAAHAVIRVQEFRGAFPELGEHRRTLGGRYPGEIAFHTYESNLGFQWIITGIGRFWVSTDGRCVRYALEPGCSAVDAEQAFIGPVLGMAVHLQGIPLLHAGAVVVGDGAIAMTAPSGIGKSTLTGTLQTKGLRVLSDDCVPVVGFDPVTVSSYLPRIKLRDDSATALGVAEQQLIPGPSWAAKRQLLLGAGAFEGDTRARYPLRALYILDPRPEDAPETVDISPVAPTDATLVLVASTFLATLLRGQLARQSMDMASAIAARVPVRRVRYPWRLSFLPQLADALLDDARALVEARP